MTNPPPRILWTLRTRGGRHVQCITRPHADGSEVEIVYDGSVVSQRVCYDDDEVEVWSMQQFAIRERELQIRLRCPRCDEVAQRSRTRGVETLLKFLTTRRPYRCAHCGWRGWRAPV